jgi:hypothetical protein
VLVGLLGVVLISALTPYNNYVLNNTGLIGSYVPVGLIAFFLILVVFINAPLFHWRPKWALGGGELTIALSMMLVGCSLPSGGLMRYLPGHLVAFFDLSSTHPQYAELMRTLHLPDWLFPHFASNDPASRGSEAVATQFYSRVPVPEGSGFITRLMAVPWRAWLVPAIAWGIFVGALLSAVVCLSALFRRQWVENERLTFPLATIYASLVESPAPGRSFNSMLRSRVFLVTFAAVFIVHGFNALNVYFPRYCPAIPLQFNLKDLATQPPLSYLSAPVLTQRLSLAVIGMMFFVQANVALSIWVFFLLSQLASAMMESHGATITEPMQVDQIFGGMVVFGCGILWVARGHLAMVGRQMVRRRSPDEPRGEYLPYWVVGWGLLVSFAVLIGWLCAAGASLIGASVLVLMIFTIYLVLAKIVAETGLLYVLIPVPLTRPWVYALSAIGQRTTLPTYFFASMFSGVLTRDLREASPVYITHAMRLTDDVPGAARPRFVGVLALSLIVGFLVAGAATLYVHYSYANTLDHQQLAPIDSWGTLDMPRGITLDSTVAYEPPHTGPIDAHNRAEHFAMGAGITLLLSVMRLRYAAWPLPPVGYLLCYTWSVQLIWASVFIGWLAKTTILRFGGGGMYRSAKPLFLGLIFGEMTAAAFWLLFSALRAAAGFDYHAIHILPY